MSALIAGAIIAAVALIFVLWPLIAGTAATRARAPERAPVRDSAVRALREIEFDRATGKLADGDYANLKSDYTARALLELREMEAGAGTAGPVAAADRAEALVNAARGSAIACGTCDAVSPEPGAVYCSTCGSYLPARCGKCGSATPEPGARFCTSCGWELAA
jgi:hypothetical protein